MGDIFDKEPEVPERINKFKVNVPEGRSGERRDQPGGLEEGAGVEAEVGPDAQRHLAKMVKTDSERKLEGDDKAR